MFSESSKMTCLSWVLNPCQWSCTRLGPLETTNWATAPWRRDFLNCLLSNYNLGRCYLASNKSCRISNSSTALIPRQAETWLSLVIYSASKTGKFPLGVLEKSLSDLKWQLPIWFLARGVRGPRIFLWELTVRHRRLSFCGLKNHSNYRISWITSLGLLLKVLGSFLVGFFFSLGNF